MIHMNIDELETDFDKAEALLHVLTETATGKERYPRLYSDLRNFFYNSPYKKLMPQWLNNIWTLDIFWSHIKPKFDHYWERREYLAEELSPLLNACQGTHNILTLQSDIIEDFSSIGVNDCWRKMLERVESDPDGAITMARTTMETVLKHLADELHETYSPQEDFSVLYKKVAKRLNLSPDNHEEQLFKSILGGCSAIAGGLGRIRNLYGDAHGQGVKQLRPHIRHARLAVNSSATLCLFLLETYEFQNGKSR
jgi:abortive phage resistance protein